MGKFSIESKTVTGESAVLEACTLGFYPREYDYTVRDSRSGDEKHVVAFSDKHAGEKIARGEFKKDK